MSRVLADNGWNSTEAESRSNSPEEGGASSPKTCWLHCFFFFDSFFSLEEGLLSCEEGVMEISSS